MTEKNVHTIADIARLAKVSKSTVSRALNDSPLISAETKTRIREIAEQNAFHINAPARQLSLRQSRTIAFVTHAAYGEYSVADLFTLEIMGGISNALHAKGYDMLVVHVDPQDTGWAHNYLDSGRVDGFILLTSTWRQRHIQALMEMEAPFIAWGVPQAGLDICSVGGDNLTGGKLATGHLVRSGKRRVAFLGGPAEELEVQQRFTGYQAALQEASIDQDPALVTYGDYAPASGATAMRRLLERAPDLDGVFVHSDLMAMAAMDVLWAAHRRVPDDVAVIGYDDLSIAQLSHPPLTTVRQNLPLAGKLLAENLIHLLQTGEKTRVVLPVELVMRQSA